MEQKKTQLENDIDQAQDQQNVYENFLLIYYNSSHFHFFQYNYQSTL